MGDDLCWSKPHITRIQRLGGFRISAGKAAEFQALLTASPQSAALGTSELVAQGDTGDLQAQILLPLLCSSFNPSQPLSTAALGAVRVKFSDV